MDASAVGFKKNEITEIDLSQSYEPRSRKESVGTDSVDDGDVLKHLGDLEMRDEICELASEEKLPNKDGFYFYQGVSLIVHQCKFLVTSFTLTGVIFFTCVLAADGQHIYLHAVNVHMLIREYGSLARCPDTVTGVIVEKEGVSMNEELRHRLRYLGHLPLICEFEVVELQLRPPIVSQDTIDAFTGKCVCVIVTLDKNIRCICEFCYLLLFVLKMS